MLIVFFNMPILGSFEIFDSNGPHGLVMRQTVPEVPICWSGDFAPFSVIGDYKWSDTVVSAAVLLEVVAFALLLGVRLASML